MHLLSKFNKKSIKIIGGVLAILLVGASILYANQDVRISVKQIKTLDIALAKGSTPLNLTNFKTDLNTALRNKGVNPNYVNVQEVDTTDISTANSSASAIFNSWEQFPVAADVGNTSWYQANWRLDASNGTIYTTSDVNCTGFWDSSKIDDKDYTIEFDAYSGDSRWADPYQFMFRMARRAGVRNKEKILKAAR